MTKTLSATPAAVAARARRALKAGKPAPEQVAAAPAAEQEETAASVFNASAFSALVNSQLGTAEAEAAEEAAIAALAKAKAPARPAASVKPALSTLYRVGAYKGRAGAMFAFMGRVGTLGDLFSREDAIASIVAKPCHEAVATRAQVLDYFAWAARHGLLVEATAAEIAAASGAAAAEADAAAARKAQKAEKARARRQAAAKSAA